MFSHIERDAAPPAGIFPVRLTVAAGSMAIPETPEIPGTSARSRMWHFTHPNLHLLELKFMQNTKKKLRKKILISKRSILVSQFFNRS